MKSTVAVVCLIIYISTKVTGNPAPINTKSILASLLSESFMPKVCPVKHCPRLRRNIPIRCIIPTIYLHGANVCFGCLRNTCSRAPPYRLYQFEYMKKRAHVDVSVAHAK